MILAKYVSEKKLSLKSTRFYFLKVKPPYERE